MSKKVLILILSAISLTLFSNNEKKLFRLPGGLSKNELTDKLASYNLEFTLNLSTESSPINNKLPIGDTQLEIERWTKYITEKSNSIISNYDFIETTIDGYIINNKYNIKHIKNNSYDNNINYYAYEVSENQKYIAFISLTESLGFYYFISIFNAETGEFLKTPYFTDIYFDKNYMIGLLGGWEVQQSELLLLEDADNEIQVIERYMLSAPVAFSIYKDRTFYAWDLGASF